MVPMEGRPERARRFGQSGREEHAARMRRARQGRPSLGENLQRSVELTLIWVFCGEEVTVRRLSAAHEEDSALRRCDQTGFASP